MLQVVGIRNRYVFAPVSPSGQFLLGLKLSMFCERCLSSSSLSIGLFFFSLSLFSFFSLSYFLSCPKKNVLVMVPLTRGGW